MTAKREKGFLKAAALCRGFRAKISSTRGVANFVSAEGRERNRLVVGRPQCPQSLMQIICVPRKAARDSKGMHFSTGSLGPLGGYL